jgi:AcrR family transcriptional regulator
MPPSLSEKTQSLKRKHILHAAIGVFAEHGFRGATIRMVAEAAGVSDGTIYTVFANKTALLLATLDPDDARAAPPSLPDPVDARALITLIFQERWRGFTPDSLALQRAIFSEVFVNEDLRALYFERMIATVLDVPAPIFAHFATTEQIAPVNVGLLLRSIAAVMLGFVTLRLLGDEQTIADWDSIPSLLSDIFISGVVRAS